MDLEEEEVNYVSVTEGRGVKKRWPLWLFFWRRFQNMAVVLNDKNMEKQSSESKDHFYSPYRKCN